MAETFPNLRKTLTIGFLIGTSVRISSTFVSFTPYAVNSVYTRNTDAISDNLDALQLIPLFDPLQSKRRDRDWLLLGFLYHRRLFHPRPTKFFSHPRGPSPFGRTGLANLSSVPSDHCHSITRDSITGSVSGTRTSTVWKAVTTGHPNVLVNTVHGCSIKESSAP